MNYTTINLEASRKDELPGMSVESKQYRVSNRLVSSAGRMQILDLLSLKTIAV